MFGLKFDASNVAVTICDMVLHMGLSENGLSHIPIYSNGLSSFSPLKKNISGYPLLLDNSTFRHFASGAGCVPVEIFQKTLVQQGVPTEDLEHMIKVAREDRRKIWEVARTIQ
jgi:hypothetical protein